MLLFLGIAPFIKQIEKLAERTFSETELTIRWFSGIVKNHFMERIIFIDILNVVGELSYASP